MFKRLTASEGIHLKSPTNRYRHLKELRWRRTFGDTSPDFSPYPEKIVEKG